MKQFARKLVIAAAATATMASAMPLAEAGERHRDHRRHQVTRHNDRAGEAIGAGIIGLALGAIVVGILSDKQAGNASSDGNPYRRPRPSPDRDFFPAPPAKYAARAGYNAAPEPWTRGWYRYCETRYRSFNPAEGTYTTFGGEKKFCIAE
jgi:hypothetical protein